LPPRGRALDEAELAALFKSCQADPDPASVRDAAILGLLYGLGLRRAELVRLDVADFHCEDGVLAIRGKGNQARTAPVVEGTRIVPERWPRVRGIAAGRPLSLSPSASGGMPPEYN